MKKQFRLELLILVVFAVFAGCAPTQSNKPFPTPTQQRVWPISSDATVTPNVEYGGVSPRLLLLNRELGIPLDDLKAMSPAQIAELIEKNAERLQVNIGKLVTTTPGTEVWITIQGRSSPASRPTLQPYPAPCPAIQRGLAFLAARFNSTLGLLNESPRVAPQKYWLTNDNALAAFALSRLGQAELNATLRASLQRYGHNANGLIEVVWGLPVTSPPFTARRVMLSKAGNAEIWQEFHTGGERFDDWTGYADLGFLMALNARLQGRSAEANAIFSNALTQFDGAGFRDKAFDGKYTTYKLALALYAGVMTGSPLPAGGRMLTALQAMQAFDGGFTTHYHSLDAPEGDANTETTALALLALWAYGCTP